MTLLEKTEIAHSAMFDLLETLTQMVALWDPQRSDETLTAQEKIQRADLDQNFATFCQDPTAILLLSQNSHLLKNIPEKALNHVITEGKHKGKSVVYGLTSSRLGQEILLKRPDIVRKISKKALNHIIDNHEEAERGRSPVFWLCVFSGGHKILRENNGVVEKVSRVAFNAPIGDEEFDNSSPFCELFYSQEGLKLLHDTRLLELIDCDTLTRPVHSPGLPVNSSPVGFMSYFRSSFNFFVNHLGHMLSLVTEDVQKDSLWSKDSTGEMTFLHYLFGDEDFVRALNTSVDQDSLDSFIQSIDPLLLNKVIGLVDNRSYSALSSLCATEAGCQFILDQPELAKKITQTGLNHPHYVGYRSNGMSTAYLLANQETGRKVYAKYPYLAERITDFGWNSAPKQSDDEHRADNPLADISLREWVELKLNAPDLADEAGSQVLLARLTAIGGIANDDQSHHLIENDENPVNAFTAAGDQVSMVGDNGLFDQSQQVSHGHNHNQAVPTR